jgi:hypothetical protein
MNNENFNINYFKSEYSESSQDTSLKRTSTEKPNTRLAMLAESIKNTIAEINNIISKNCDIIEKKRPDLNRRKKVFDVKRKEEDFENFGFIKDDLFYDYVYPNNYENDNNDPFMLQVKDTNTKMLFGEELRNQMHSNIIRIQKIDEAVNHDPTIFEDLANLSFSSTGIITFYLDSKKKRPKKYYMFTAENKRRWVCEAKETSPKNVSKKYGIPIKSLKRWLQVGPDRKKGSVINI